MPIERWSPSSTITPQEEFLLKRARKKRRLFAFLREHRAELFDDKLQGELEEMYRDTGAGKEALCPAMMAMALILQGYLGLSDADAVEMTVVDLRWQMVLDRLGATKPAFSQGALFAFRERLIEYDMDRRLLERTAEPPVPRKDSTPRNCRRRCASRSIRARWKAQAGSRTPST